MSLGKAGLKRLEVDKNAFFLQITQKIKQIHKNINEPLQAHIFCHRTTQRIKKYMVNVSFSKKKAALSIFNQTASLTVEAALAMPFVLFVLMTLISMMNLFRVQESLQHSLSETAKSTAICAYDEETAKLMFLPEWYEQLDHELIKKSEIVGKAGGISIISSEIGNASGQIKVTAQYYVKPGYGVLPIPPKLMASSAYARIWSGDGIVGDEEEENEEYVYVAENGQVYHVNSHCSHIDLSIENVSFSQIDGIRNQYAERYKACEKCCQNGHMDSVFITDTGNRYHSQTGCSGLKRTIRKVLKSEIGHMAACQRCGGG